MRTTFTLLLASSALVLGAPAPQSENNAALIPRALTKMQFDCVAGKNPPSKPMNCANACFAANCGNKPGVALAAIGGLSKASSGDLHYGGKGMDDINRKVSGFALAKTKGGQAQITALGAQGAAGETSLDEWPPASTKEGGAGVSLRYVPLSEQRSQGGQTYKDQDLTDPDHYYELQDWNGVPECVAYQAGDKSGCTTNKKQFHVVGTTFKQGV